MQLTIRGVIKISFLFISDLIFLRNKFKNPAVIKNTEEKENQGKKEINIPYNKAFILLILSILKSVKNNKQIIVRRTSLEYGFEEKE